MSTIERMKKEDTKEPVVSLGSLKGGECFRFSHVTYEEALKENLFYLVFSAPEKDRILVGNPANGERLTRDKEHRVIKHNSKFLVLAHDVN